MEKPKVIKVTSEAQVIELFGRPQIADDKLRELWMAFRTMEILAPRVQLSVVRVHTDNDKPSDCDGPCCRKR